MKDEIDQSEKEASEDELIDAALAALDGELPSLSASAKDQTLPKQQTGVTEPTPEMMAAMDSTSPTLQALAKNRRPSQKTVCERCPHSVWFASPEEVKCYCRVMFLVSWSTTEPNQIINCDGEFLSKE